MQGFNRATNPYQVPILFDMYHSSFILFRIALNIS